MARSRRRGRAITRAAGPAAGLDPRHRGSAENRSRMLRADEPSRGRDDGRAREHARLGTPTHAEGRVTLAVHAMTVSSAYIPATRGPDNELYDRGCDLVEAAMAIRRVADAPEVVRAVPAVLGCIEAALRELLWAVAALEETSARAVERRSGCTDSSAKRRSEHAARLCEPPDGSRRRRARFGSGSVARRTRAGGRKRCVSTASSVGGSGNGVQPRNGRSMSHVQVAGGSLAGNDHSLISSTVGRVDVGSSSSTARAGGSGSGGRSSDMRSSLDSRYGCAMGSPFHGSSHSTDRLHPM